MRTSTTNGYTITYPNKFFETRGRFAYVKVQGDDTVEAGEDMELTITGSATGKSVTILRSTDANKAVVFPIGALCESLMSGSADAVSCSIRKSGGATDISTFELSPIVGYWSREMELSGSTSISPFAKKIVVYPNSGFTQTGFVPTDDKCSVNTDEPISVNNKGPYITFDPSKITADNYSSLKIVVADSFIGPKAIKLNADYDPCTNGVFLKWTDAAGMPYLYRWTQEAETDDVSVDSTYRKLDDTLTPYDVQSKTRAKRYTLHSRIVERDIFEMCRTILGAQEVFMYDRDANDWVRVLIEDAESEDTGAVMQDVEIEVVKYEYL